MAKRPIIRIGDPTSHGGTVLEAFPTLTIYGKNAAGVGHQGHCPLCKRDFVIVAGAESYIYFGKNVALEGMHTSCGAVLIATQGQATVDDSSGLSQILPALTSSHKAEDEAIEHWYTLEDEEGKPVEGYCYDLYQSDELVTHKGSFNSGKTSPIQGGESSYVMWLERDSAKRDVVSE